MGFYNFRGKHKLSNDEMPTISRRIPFTIEAYTKNNKPHDDNNNNVVKMESENSNSSFDHTSELMYSPASQSGSSAAYSPVSYPARSTYSPASQSVTPTFPHSPIPSSAYTPPSQPSTPTYQQNEAPTSFAELFFANNATDALQIKQEKMSPEEGLVPQQISQQTLDPQSLVVHPDMLPLLQQELLQQETKIPEEEILPIFTLPSSLVAGLRPESQILQPDPVTSHPSPLAPAQQPAQPPKPASLPPPPPYTHNTTQTNTTDTSYNLAISTRAQSFLEQLGEMLPPPSYFETMTGVYPQYSSSSMTPPSKTQPEYTKVSSPYPQDNQVVPNGLQPRDIQFVDL